MILGGLNIVETVYEISLINVTTFVDRWIQTNADENYLACQSEQYLNDNRKHKDIAKRHCI